MIAKSAYLRQLTSASMQMRSLEIGSEMEGSSPPSVFIGSYNYPDVYAGPMIAPVHGDTVIMDTPEDWISRGHTQEEIIGFRLSLVRGKRRVTAKELDTRFVEKLQEISMSPSSVESEAAFSSPPQGTTFSEDHAPFGPSASLERFEIAPGTWDRGLEKVYYDTDLRAADAVVDLHTRGLPFSAIQKAFSVGTMGAGKDRRLVPTGWSITACDTIIGDRLLKEVKQHQVIDTWKVHEFSSLNNTYAVILMPTAWQYEWSEAFLHVLGDEELVYSDHEGFAKKTEYSPLGGCYYSCKMAVLEALAAMKRQAGVIVLREAIKGYVPLGVFNVRENVRAALIQQAKEFEDLSSAVSHIREKFVVPMERFRSEGTLLEEMLHPRQSRLQEFL